MILKIVNVDLRYEDSELERVSIGFEGYGEEENSIRLNGVKNLDPEEYLENQTPDKLEKIIRSALNEQDAQEK